MRFASLIAPFALIACHVADGAMCTQIGCTDGFDVRLDRASWPEGSYEIEVQVDGVVVTCAATIPIVEGEGGCPASSGVWIELSGSRLSVDQQSIPGAHVDDTGAAEVVVTIRQDGVEVASETFAPAWAESQPNGPDCPPTCRMASATMVVSG